VWVRNGLPLGIELDASEPEFIGQAMIDAVLGPGS